MPFYLAYPRNNTKVSNPEITFRWKKSAGAQKYVLVIFRLAKGRNPQWERISVHQVTGNKYRTYLRPGYLYHAIVATADAHQGPLLRAPFRQPRFPRRLRSPVPTPELHPLLVESVHASTTFYIKKSANYLKKYLTIKSEELKTGQHLPPTIPLLFYLVQRYYRWAKDPANLQQKPLDENFAQAMDTAPPEFRSLERLDQLLRLYGSANLKNLRDRLFGPTFNEFPQDGDADNWINQALDALFEGTWLDDLRQAGQYNKSMDLEFKYAAPLIAHNVPLEGDLRIPVAPQLVGTAPDRLNMNRTYSLKIIAQNGDSAVFPLQLIKEDSGHYFLQGPGGDLGAFDAAPFNAELWERDPVSPEAGDRLWGPNGILEIKGGIPIVLGVEPNTVPEGSTQEIKITVRDGGRGKKVVLRHGNQAHDIPTDPNKSLIRSQQTLKHQVFTFRLTDCAHTITPETYDLTFQNADQADSINSLVFVVKGWEYRVWISELKCIDESNPEWWGDDSVSFQTFINTDTFLQIPTSSKVYDGFHDGKRRTSFSSYDNHVYPYAIRPSGRRIIEGHLAINVAIYEHDDLGWLGWLINAVVDLVQSFLAHLVDAFTFGLGGYIILAGLEVSGLNDMREQAVDSMVAGWEVEVLHQGSTALLPGTASAHEWPLEMATSESRYKVTLRADRAMQT
jgi:hypothetical protein